jgi:hypothetical protein
VELGKGMRSIILAVAVGLTSLAPSLARAQSGEATPAPIVRTDDEKSPPVAFLLSFGVTTAGIVTTLTVENDHIAVLGATAGFFGPATGRWYAGESGLAGMGLRTLGGGVALYGVVQILKSDCELEEKFRCPGNRDLGVALLIGGAGLWIGSAVADMLFAASDARRYNERRRLMLAPTALRDGTPGLALTGAF